MSGAYTAGSPPGGAVMVRAVRRTTAPVDPSTGGCTSRTGSSTLVHVDPNCGGGTVFTTPRFTGAACPMSCSSYPTASTPSIVNAAATSYGTASCTVVPAGTRI